MWVSFVDKTTCSIRGQIADWNNGLGTLELIPVTIQIEIE